MHNRFDTPTDDGRFSLPQRHHRRFAERDDAITHQMIAVSPELEHSGHTFDCYAYACKLLNTMRR